MRNPSEDWRAFASMLRRRAEESRKLAGELAAMSAQNTTPQAVSQACASIYAELADFALSISKGQYR